MSRNSVPKDMVDLLRANVAAQGPFYPDEWGKTNAGKLKDKQSIISDSPGGPSIIGDSYERVIFTIHFRGAKNERTTALWDRAIVVHDFLLQAPVTTINGEEYPQFEAMAPLQMMTRDESARPLAFAKYFSYRNVR